MILLPSVVWPSFEMLTWAENLLTVCTSCAAARACRPSLFLISNFLTHLFIRLLFDISMLHMNAQLVIAQSLLQLLHQNHRTMTPPRAAEGQGQAALSFTLVERQC